MRSFRHGLPFNQENLFDRILKLTAYVKAAAETVPSLQTKHVLSHSFRHATAVHLVSAGVEITIIRSWLGHVSLDTTNHYAKANLETKRKALELVDVPTTGGHRPLRKRMRACSPGSTRSEIMRRNFGRRSRRSADLRTLLRIMET
jgi:hypothetical protein